MLVRDVCNYLDKRFPKETAEEFDNAVYTGSPVSSSI